VAKPNPQMSLAAATNQPMIAADERSAGTLVFAAQFVSLPLVGFSNHALH
jgi:hypothetical protein